MPVFKRAKSVDEVEARIRAVLTNMRPLLRNDDFAVELVRFDEASQTALLRFGGGCPDCDMTAAKLMRGIEAHLRRRVPELRAVRTEVHA